jgi:hypothetical protein
VRVLRHAQVLRLVLLLRLVLSLAVRVPAELAALVPSVLGLMALVPAVLAVLVRLKQLHTQWLVGPACCTCWSCRGRRAELPWP